MRHLLYDINRENVQDYTYNIVGKGIVFEHVESLISLINTLTMNDELRHALTINLSFVVRLCASVATIYVL